MNHTKIENPIGSDVIEILSFRQKTLTILYDRITFNDPLKIDP